MTPAQTELLNNLGALRVAVAATSVLRTILDDSWFETVETAIQSDSPSHTIPADPTGLLYDFWHLRTMLPVIEQRLAAVVALPLKADKVKVKLNELHSARHAPSFKNHLFELNVLGDLALRGVLVDIEDSATGVDGAIRIDGRDILVEATNTLQRVIPEVNGVFFGSPDVEIDQVIKKVRKKVAEGRQLARASGEPTILFLARTFMGASRESADAALRECFRLPDFAALSGVVLSDSYRLHVTSWRPGASPDVPLTDRENEQITAWYAVR